MADVPTTEHLIDSTVDAATEKATLGHLLVLRDRGDLTDEGMTEIGQMLGLIPDPDVDNRPKRGHVKGGRGRAVPVDWTRRGAVGA